MVPLVLETPARAVVSETGLRGFAVGSAYAESAHAVVGLTKDLGRNFVGPRAGASMPWPRPHHCQHGGQLGIPARGRTPPPLMEANIPAPATAAQFAASMTFPLTATTAPT